MIQSLTADEPSLFFVTCTSVGASAAAILQLDRDATTADTPTVVLTPTELDRLPGPRSPRPGTSGSAQLGRIAASRRLRRDMHQLGTDGDPGIGFRLA